MARSLLLPVLALLMIDTVTSTLAQSTNGATGAVNSTAPTVIENEITVHVIAVGETEHYFTPNSINALPGDIVMFKFWPGNHSVIQAAFGYPCVPYEDIQGQGVQGFYSGTQSPDDGDVSRGSLPTWNLTVNTTAPTFFYCGAPGSCIGWGMLGAINADASHPIATQIELARKANYMLTPGQSLPTDARTSLRSMADGVTATPVLDSGALTSAVSSTTASITEPSIAGSGVRDATQGRALSTGQVIGIVFGVIVAIALAAGLLWWVRGDDYLFGQDG